MSENTEIAVTDMQPIETTAVGAVTQEQSMELPVPAATDNINRFPTMWNTPKLMTQAWKMAEMISKSDIVPIAFKNKPQDCLIAIDMANRMNVSPIVIMSWLYVVHGKPSWSGQACVSLINNCGRFKGSLEFVYTGEKDEMTYGCYAQIHKKEDGKLIKGTEITMQMVHGEGWHKNTKWTTLKAQMLAYRAAAFFARLYCPEALMGLQTADELKDVHGDEPKKSKTIISLEEQ